MSGIKGTIRENNSTGEQEKYVGVFTAKVLAVNPTVEQFKDLLGIELKEDSKATDYLGENKDGYTTLRVDFWMEDEKYNTKFKKSFFLEDRVRENKDGSKKQYINTLGSCSWASDESGLPAWFIKREYREANVGEEKLYNFLKVWLGGLDLKSEDAELQLDWKKLMKGNVKDLKDQVGGSFCQNVLGVATIKTVEKTNDAGETEIKEYQDIYEEFLPVYNLKSFQNIDYSSEKVRDVLSQKESKELKYVERFVLGIYGEYGSKNFFDLKEMRVYNSTMNLAASNEVFSTDDADY